MADPRLADFEARITALEIKAGSKKAEGSSTPVAREKSVKAKEEKDNG